MKLYVALGILLSGHTSGSRCCALAFIAPTCSSGTATPPAAFVLPPSSDKRRIPLALRVSGSASRRLTASTSPTARLAHKAASSNDGEVDGDDSPSEHDDDNHNGAGDTSSSSHAGGSISSQIYADDDCYDLCDVFDDSEFAEDNGVGDSSSTEKESSTSSSTSDTGGGSIRSSSTTAPSRPTQDTSGSTRKSILGNPMTASPQSSSSASTSSSAPTSTQPKDPERIRQNLELHWQVATSDDECDVQDIRTCSEECATCHGSGKTECRFCTGTGFLTIGQVVVGAGGSCPICNAEGEVDCSDCKGSGWVANWRQLNLTGGSGGGGGGGGEL